MILLVHLLYMAQMVPGVVLSLGFFADGSYGDGWNGVPGTVKGLFYGDARQFFAELIGGVTCFVFVFVVMYVFFKISNKITLSGYLRKLKLQALIFLKWVFMVM